MSPWTNIPQVYNCRSSDQWEDDLALSVTYSPEHRTTHAVLYGCTEATRNTFQRRLSLCDSRAAFHPLTLPTIFADIERDRLFAKVKPLVTKLVDRALSISKAPPPPPAAGALAAARKTSRSSSHGGADGRSAGKTPEEDLMKLWLGVSRLRRGLEAAKAQLLKMLVHCRGMNFDESPSPRSHAQWQLDELQDLVESQERIEQRLVELIGEYDEKIMECAEVIDGMVLAAQLVSKTEYLLPNNIV